MTNAARFRTTNGMARALLVACAAVIVGSGCGQGFQAKPGGCVDCGANNGAGADDGGDTGGGGTTPADQAWKNLQLDGAISNGRYAQTPVISLDKTNKVLKLRLPMVANPFLLLTGEIPLKEIPGAKLSWEQLPPPDNSPVMVLSIPLDKLIRGLDFPNKSKLPNGEDFPGLAGGELPSFAVSLVPIRDIKATIYLSPSVVAVFVNTPFDPYIRTTAIPIRDQTMTRTLGYFAIIPAVGGHDGGFYVSAQMPADIARIIDDAL